MQAESQTRERADAAGVRSGDVIKSFAGQDVEKVKDLTRLAAGADPGTQLAIEVWRDGDTVELDLQVGSSADDASAPATARATPPGKLGLSLAPLTDEHRLRARIAPDVEGAVVAGVAAGSTAAKKGLRVGDVIVMVNQRPVSGPGEVVREVGKAREAARSSVLLKIVRGTQSQYVALGLA